MGQGIPPTLNYLCGESDIAGVGTILNVFSYDAVSVRDSPPRRRADALRVELRPAKKCHPSASADDFL